MWKQKKKKICTHLLKIKRERYTSITKTFTSPKQKQASAWALLDGNNVKIHEQKADMWYIGHEAQRRETSQQLMSSQYVQYSNETLTTWSYRFYQPIKNQVEQLAHLKTTDI